MTPLEKVKIVVDIDRYITTEFPDPILEATLYRTVATCTLHGPSRLLNKDAPCMKDGSCSKSFPKPFQETTIFDKDGYDHYKMNAFTCHMMESGTIVDNGYVVPYNK